MGLERAEQLYEKVFVEYGDDSVAQLGGVHLACEQSSNVLSKVLEWGRLMAYLEQSTRYIAYNQRLDNGQYRYYRPPEILDSPHGARFVGEMDRVFDTYGALLPRMQAWVAERFPQQAGDSDFVYRQATRAKSLDALRGLLPAASLSNIGIYGTGQSYEQLLLRMRAHPLPEARHYADMMLVELRKVIPSFLQRVDVPERGGEWSAYLATTRDQTARVVARLWPELGPDVPPRPRRRRGGRGDTARLRSGRRGEGPGGGLFLPPRLLRARGGLPGTAPRPRRPRRAVAGLRGRTPQPPAPPGPRLRADRLPLRARHGLRRVPRPAAPSHAHHRVAAPRHLARLRHARPRRRGGTRGALRRGHRSGRGALPLAAAATSPKQASYAVALAHRIRYVMQLNAREAMHLVELRSGTQGHPAYRRVAQQMHRAIAEVAGHRALAEAMSFVDHGATDLERLESERRAERRRAEKSATH